MNRVKAWAMGILAELCGIIAKYVDFPQCKEFAQREAVFNVNAVNGKLEVNAVNGRHAYTQDEYRLFSWIT